MNVSVAQYVGEGLLKHLVWEGARLEKRGDRFFLVRQLEYFRLSYTDCRCHEHSCRSCEIALELQNELAELTKAQREETDVHGSVNHGQRARAVWVGAQDRDVTALALVAKRWEEIVARRRLRAGKAAIPARDGRTAAAGLDDEP